MATSTPWGLSDSTHKIAPGITAYTTPRHGGIRLSPTRRAAMPKVLRDKPTFAGGNWYEEDCDVALVMAAFPEYFPTAPAEKVAKYLKDWHGIDWK